MSKYKMDKRITAIVGAGSVLGFGINEANMPSTTNITMRILSVSVEDKDGKQQEIMKMINDKLKERFDMFSQIGITEHYSVNFETLFHLLEMLYSYNDCWQKDVYPFPWVAVLLKPVFELFVRKSYHDALVQCVKEIIQVINTYDSLFANRELQEQWYRVFWTSIGNGLDVFSFNYDNTIENSIAKFNDGFVLFTPDYQRFEPEVLWNNENDLPTICHLHGNILYGNAQPGILQGIYSSRDLFKFRKVDLDNLELFMFPRNQAQETIVNTPIITGMHKMDKMCYMPHSFYHAFFTRKILENPSLLIVGYSFNDIYVNQIINRHKLIHSDKQRVVIIDKWQIDEKSDINSFVEYIYNNTSLGCIEFLNQMIWDEDSYYQGVINNQDFKLRFIAKMQWEDHFWSLKDHCMRLYINGFKSAVENYQNEIIEYLKSNE